MGIVKQHMADEEAKREAAVFILKKAGILTSCQYHEEITYQTYAGDLVEAYKHGNANWAHYSGLFKDRRELTDKILEMSKASDYGNDGCEICRGQFDKD